MKLTVEMVGVILKFNNDSSSNQEKMQRDNKAMLKVLKSFADFDYTKEEMKAIAKLF